MITLCNVQKAVPSGIDKAAAILYGMGRALVVEPGSLHRRIIAPCYHRV
jgi:hypothetical protein